MCGISGYFHPQRESVSDDVIPRMLRAQRHRGPDADGVFKLDHVALLHNRLSLLDLSKSGNQPFQNERHSLVYNGEIYNFKELKREFEDVEFRSGTDTEVLFHALNRWGVAKTLRRIKGMFAFAWYDRRDDRLVLARDRLGIKPLFYGSDKRGVLWFASELKTILTGGRFESNEVIAMYSAFGCLERAPENTAWKNVHLLNPGHYVECSKSGVVKHEYFNICDLVEESEHRRLDRSSRRAVLEEFEERFRASVSSMMVADAPVGTFVSGGVDSSLIASYAQESAADLKLFTANVVGPCSEYESASQLAQSLDAELLQYRFEKPMILRDLAAVTHHYESPLVVHFNALPFSNIASVARESGVKAVLTGEGADELFLGYPRLLAKRYDWLLRLPHALLDWIYARIPPLKSYVSASGGGGDLGVALRNSVDSFGRRKSFQRSDMAYGFLPEKVRREHGLTAQMLTDSIVALLWRNDRMGMMHSIESRFPFLDEDLLAFGMNLPVKFKIGRTAKFHNLKHPFLIDKYVVRRLAAKRIPDVLANQRKKGFPTVGLSELDVSGEFFAAGPVEEMLAMTADGWNHARQSFSKYHYGILAAVDVWARLFLRNEGVKAVAERVSRHIKIREN